MADSQEDIDRAKAALAKYGTPPPLVAGGYGDINKAVLNADVRSGNPTVYNAPSDEELSHDVRQGAVDAAASEDASRSEATINPYNLRSAGRAALKVASPLASYLYEKNLKADQQTPENTPADTTSVVSQTGPQAAQGAMDRLNAAGALNPNGRVVGYTKAGFIPSSKQNQSQIAREQMPDGYWDLVNQEMGAANEAGQAKLSQQQDLLQQQQHAGDVRKQLVDTFIDNDNEANAREDKALQGAQDRINSAIEDFKNSGPQQITYRDIWNNEDTGGKVLSVLGFIAGSLGSAKGAPNAFLTQIDNDIQRKIRIQELESERKGRAVGFANNAYDVIHQRVRDREATRKILTAMYLGQFDQQVQQQADAIGLNYNSGRAADFRSQLLDRYRQLLKEGSAKVVESEAESQKYAPATAIVQAGQFTPEDYADATAYEKDRREKMLPEKHAAIQQIRDAADALGEKGEAGRLLVKRFLSNPKGLASSVYLESLPPNERAAINQLSSGINTLMRQEGGKTLTDTEISRTLSSIVGNGSREDIHAGADSAQQQVDQLEQSLHAAHVKGYDLANLLRKVYGNTAQPHLFSGSQRAPDETQSVVSPEPNVPRAKPGKRKKEE